jgi:aminoglycoside phosphotransferase (APT) family kinase protein
MADRAVLVHGSPSSDRGTDIIAPSWARRVTRCGWLLPWVAMSPDREPDGAGDEARVVEWITANLGGEVTAISRQARWRPAWFADVRRRGGTDLALYVRGERTDMAPIFPLEHEWQMQQLFSEHGIPVPRVYGFCARPKAIVMERTFGSVDFRDHDPAERDSVMAHYAEILARMHALDLEPFVHAGAERPGATVEVAQTGMRAYERAFRATKRRPDPFMEFCLAWLHRHPPAHRVRPAPVVWDSGQFMHREGRVVSLLDLELAHIGDALMDLAGLRMRDTVLHYGDLTAFYDRYAELSGEPVDLDAIEYHHFAFSFTTQLALHGALADPTPETDLMNYLQWCSETNLYALESLAQFTGVALRQVDSPEPARSPAEIAHRHLVRSLRALPATDEHGAYRQRIAFRLARHVQRVDEIGQSIVDADLDDLAELLGVRPRTWSEGEEALEAFVLSSGGERDASLIALFNRRLHRQRMLLGPAGSAIAAHLPLSPLR